MSIKLKLLSDQAIGESDELRIDGLGFETYSQILGTAAKDTKGPFTIGIFGEWGTGKTSLMKLIQKSLSNDTNILTVWFNAWRYEKEEHPIVPLVATIIREMELKKDWLEKFEHSGSKLLRALRAVAYGFSAKSKVKVPGFAEIEASFVAKDMIERADKLFPDPLLDRSLYYQAFETLSNVRLKEESKVVVIIDDLDRCFPDLAIKLLESIKLVLSQPNFIFILGVARSIIEGYLQHRYEKDYGLKNFEGNAYLDKIVQLPFHIPPHNERMQDFSKSLIEQLDKEDQKLFKEILPIIGFACGSNPRATVRFVNNLLIDRAINQALSKQKLMEEIPMGYFAVSRSLQQRWPQIYAILITAEDICSEISIWKTEDIEKNLESSKEDISNIAATLIADKELQKLLLSSQGVEWLTNSSIRMAATQFLRTQRQETSKGVRESKAKYDIFFSYHREDRSYVTKIVQILEKMNINVFFDSSSIQPGMEWKKEIQSALNTCKYFGYIVGAKTHESSWAQYERDIVQSLSPLSSDRPRIIPILVPGAKEDKIPDFVKHVQWLDLRDTEINEESLLPLIRVLIQ